jgi:hypothetical protein
MGLVSELYEPHVAVARQLLEEDPKLRRLLDPQSDPAVLELFLIHFSSLGVNHTQYVEQWMRTAGRRCLELGLGDLGEALIRHAKYESGHDRLMEQDTRVLVDRWNRRGGVQLDADALLSRPPSAGGTEIISLVESVVNGPRPQLLVAIDLEIERMSIVVGPPMLEQFTRTLGPDISEGLTFLEEHVTLDQGHTVFNNKQVEGLLQLRPQDARALAETGSAAIRAYVHFIGDCIDLAVSDAGVLGGDRLLAADGSR